MNLLIHPQFAIYKNKKGNIHMFYDKNGKTISEGNTIKFQDKEYVIGRINGDRFGEEGTSTLTLKGYKGEEVPCENNVELV